MLSIGSPRLRTSTNEFVRRSLEEDSDHAESGREEREKEREREEREKVEREEKEKEREEREKVETEEKERGEEGEKERSVEERRRGAVVCEGIVAAVGAGPEQEEGGGVDEGGTEEYMVMSPQEGWREGERQEPPSFSPPLPPSPQGRQPFRAS